MGNSKNPGKDQISNELEEYPDRYRMVDFSTPRKNNGRYIAIATIEKGPERYEIRTEEGDSEFEVMQLLQQNIATSFGSRKSDQEIIARAAAYDVELTHHDLMELR